MQARRENAKFGAVRVLAVRNQAKLSIDKVLRRIYGLKIKKNLVVIATRFYLFPRKNNPYSNY